MTVRWAIVGCGWISDDQIAPAIRKAEGCELVAVASRSAEKGEDFRRRHAAQRVYTDLDPLLADTDIDAVFLATPNGQHAAETMACAQDGKHVLVEKPMATSVADAESMIRACHDHGTKLSVGYHMRFHPLHVEAARLVRQGQLGSIASARCQFFFRYPDMPTEWRQQVASAGWWALGDVGTHGLDLLIWLLGDVAEVSAVLANARFAVETEDLAVLLLRFQNGSIATLDCSTGIHSPASKLELYGTEGNLIGKNTLGMGTPGKMNVGTHTGQRRTVDYAAINPYVAEIEAFSRAIRDDTAAPIPPKAGLQNVRVLEAAARSAREHRTVTLD